MNVTDIVQTGPPTPSRPPEERPAPVEPAGSGSARWLRLLVHGIGLVLPLALGWFTYRDLPDLALVGGDSFALIDASRIESASDLLGALRETYGDRGPGYPYYRPLASLLLGAEYRLFGLTPAGYQWTTLGLYLLCVALVYLATRRLLGAGAWFGPLIAAVFFALHPVLLTALPAVGRQPELLVTAALLLLLVMLPQRPIGFSGWAVLAALVAGVACGVHEAGVISVLLILFHQLMYGQRGRLRDTLHGAFRAAAPTFTVVWVYVIAHTMMVGGLGRVEQARQIGGLASTGTGVMRLLNEILCPAPVMSGISAPRTALAAGIVLGVLAAGLLVAGSVARVGRWPRTANLVVLSLAWSSVSLPLLAYWQSSAPWQTLVPLAGVALLVGAAAQAAADLLAGSRLIARVAAGITLAGVLGICATGLRWSPLHTRYDAWREASSTLRHTLEELSFKLQRSQPGQTVGIDFLTVYETPRSERRPFLRQAGVLDVPSLRAWCRLAFPTKPILVVYRRNYPPWFQTTDKIIVVALPVNPE